MPRKAEPAYKTENSVFSQRLREIMKERGENQTTLAEKIAEQFLTIQRQTISLYMNGQSRPDTERLTAIAKTLNVSADWLLGLSDVKTFDGEFKQVCDFTKLSEGAVKFLQYIADNPEEPKSDMLPLVLSLILENYRFFQALGGIALACSLECKYDKPGDIEKIEKFEKEHREELQQMGASVWATGATSDMFLSQAVDRFMDCAKEVRHQFSGNVQQ